MMAALELAQAHTEGRVIWGPVLAFAHGQGDKMCEEPYKFPCAKDGSFGTYVYYMHAERLYDNVHDVLTFFDKWTHVEAPSCHPVPQGTVSLTVEQQNVELRNRVVRSEADRQAMPEGTKLAVYNCGNVQQCPWVYWEEDELPGILSEESLFPTSDGCGEACWISSTGEFMYSRETPYYTLRTSGRGQVRSGYWRSESRDKSFGGPRRIQTNLFGVGVGGERGPRSPGSPGDSTPKGWQTHQCLLPCSRYILKKLNHHTAMTMHRVTGMRDREGGFLYCGAKPVQVGAPGFFHTYRVKGALMARHFGMYKCLYLSTQKDRSHFGGAQTPPSMHLYCCTEYPGSLVTAMRDANFGGYPKQFNNEWRIVTKGADNHLASPVRRNPFQFIPPPPLLAPLHGRHEVEEGYYLK